MEKMELGAEFDRNIFKVPAEMATGTFRSSQRSVEKELLSIQNTLNKMEADHIDLESLESIAERLEKTAQSVEISKDEEVEYISRCQSRLSIYDNALSQHRSEYWNSVRLSVMIMEHMLRIGCYETARVFAESTNLLGFLDAEIFTQSIGVVEALKQGDCSVAIKWCQDNKSRLRKIDSPLEFEVRHQEFIEMIRNSEIEQAVAYARKFLSPFLATHGSQVRSALTLFALGPNPCEEPYQSLLNPARLEDLCQLFIRENYKLHGFWKSSCLSVALRLGAVSLKTSFCFNDEFRCLECPICDPSMRNLAEHIPSVRKNLTALKCRISGATMDENNPPFALPNGQVYSQRALEEIANQNNGMARCPITGQTHALQDAKRVFIC